MNRLITIIFGALSCIAAAFLNFYIQELTTINIFSFSIFFLLPVGAIFVGMAATSGYYLSALMTHRMLDKYDFITMVGMAAIGMILIYGIGYYFDVEKSGLGGDITFWQYVAFVVKNATFHVQITKFPLFTKLGSMGKFGYLFLLIRFVGFIVGGAITFLLLVGADTCTKCSKYMRHKKKLLFFDNKQNFDNYLKKIEGLKLTSNTFKSTLFSSDLKLDKVQDSIKYTWQLKKCNACNAELLCGKGEIYQVKEWSAIKDANKKIIMPINSDFEKQWDN